MFSRQVIPPPTVDTPDVVRERGDRSLYVYKLSGSQAQRTSSGDRFQDGDRLRFAADVPSAGHLNILGVEASGAGALDASIGRETLYLIHCPTAVGAPATVCQNKMLESPLSPPSCPDSCTLTPFVLNKDRARE